MRCGWLIIAVCVGLAACHKATPSRAALSDDELRAMALERGWQLDTRVADHQKADPNTGLPYPVSTSLDETWIRGQQAWGIPRRLASKVFRYVARREAISPDPRQAQHWLDRVGAAAQAAPMEPGILLRIYWEERKDFEAAGLSFDQSIALIAGMRRVQWDDIQLQSLLKEALGALADPAFLAELEKQGLQTRPTPGTIDGWSILSDLDRLQCQYKHGKARSAYWQTIRAQNAGLVLMLDSEARAVSCDLLGQLQCSRGATFRKMAREKGQDTTPTHEYSANNNLLQSALRTVSR